MMTFISEFNFHAYPHFLFLFITLLSIISFIALSNNLKHIKSVSIIGASLLFIHSTAFLFYYDNNLLNFQYLESFRFSTEILGISFNFAIDGLSIFFLILTNFLNLICHLFLWNDSNYRGNSLLLYIVTFFLVIIFTVLDLLLFYIFFEAILIPMYIMIGLFGSRDRKIRASYLFFFYTLCGSLLFLIGIIYIYTKVGTFDYSYIAAYKFTFEEELFLWLAFFFSFASKIPMFPFHIWLPEAHVEAPTVGSVLLAGILLKLGVYGFIRYSLIFFPYASFYFSPLVYLLGIMGVIYASLTALRQTDVKRVIAYSSVAHMNLVAIGIFSFNNIGIHGAILQSISHGFVAGGLFLLIGILYSRYHTRFIYYYGGIVHFMPLFSTAFLILTLANIALPGTGSFVGEFLLLNGIFQQNSIIAIFATLGVILCGGYSLWLYNKIIFGNIKTDYTLKYTDFNFREFIIVLFLIIFVIAMGISPNSYITYFPHFNFF